ncbi:MAG: rhodanese-like domain-containing protein [Candidatus Promineifilaceae bacterium]|nr:rhodanese-like domain-containing protein [Candidatus Promineifilaceae bacterium]
MSNRDRRSIPEISPAEVARRQSAGEELTLLDVREPVEWRLANLGDDVLKAPMSRLVREGVEALPTAARDREAEIIVFCHHGVRSAQVVAWLRQHGWHGVLNLAGGIDAYARDVDSSVGLY